MIAYLADGAGIVVIYLLALGFLYFGLGNLSYPHNWRYTVLIIESYVYLAISLVLIAIATTMWIT